MIAEIYESALKHPVLTRESERELMTEYARVRAEHGASHEKTLVVRNRIVRSFLRLRVRAGR